MGYSGYAAVAMMAAATASAFPQLAARGGATLTTNPFANPTGIPNPAGPNPNDPRFTKWTPPGAGDVRAPCPGLNTLANHNFIHHNGKNMTIPHLVEGLAAGMNIGPDFSIAIGAAGLLSSPFPLLGSFDLNDLDMHNFPIEHDASLSRQDAYFGNDYSFNQDAWNMILKTYGSSPTTSIALASQAKMGRLNDSIARNPTLVYGPREFVLSYGETALYLQTMAKDVVSGVAPLSYVRSMFEKEKLPYDQGWRPVAEPVTLVSLANMINSLVPASGDPVKEISLVTADIVKDAFEGVDPVKHILANATSLL